MTTTDEHTTQPAPEADPRDATDPLDREVAPEVDELEASVSLFEGDEGGLGYPERHALVALLKQRFVSSRTHPRDWQALVENERVLRGRLNELFLELHVDPVREVAWKRQAFSETGAKFPTLLHDTAWSREETIVLVHLRDRLRQAAAAGEDRVFVDREDLVEHVAGFRPLHATDVAGDEKRARNAVAAINKAGLLVGAPTDDRFEISAAVESLLPLELLRELLETLRETNDPAPEPVEEPLFGAGDDAAEEPGAGDADGGVDA